MQKHFPLLKEYARIKHDMDIQADMAMQANADLTGTQNLMEDGRMQPASTAIDRVEEAPDEDADEQAIIENVIEAGIAQPTGSTNSVQVFSMAHSRNEKVQQQPIKKQLILNPTIN